MKTYKILLASLLAFTMANCDDHDSTIAVQDVPLSVGFAKSADIYSIDPVNPVYRIAVTSTQVSSVDRTITLALDESTTDDPEISDFVPGDFTFNNTVVIPAGSYVGYGEITFDFDNVPAGLPSNRRLVFDIVSPNDGSIKNNTKNQIVVQYKPLCSTNELTLNITFDNYSEEISWELYDALGNPVATSNGVYAADLTTASAVFCVEDGDYIFVMNDSYGDGMCCESGAGSYKITDALGNVIVNGSGDFSSFELHEFTLGN